MSSTDLLLLFVSFMLVVIWVYIRWIYLKLEYGKVFDATEPVNQYGEGLSDAIQNAFVRGQRGISTYE